MLYILRQLVINGEALLHWLKWCCLQAAADAADLENSQETEEEKQEKRLQEGIGIPHVIIDCADNSKTAFLRAVETGKLPSAEEVSFCVLFCMFLYIEDCYRLLVSVARHQVAYFR